MVCIKMTDMHENYIQIERQEVRKFAYVSETFLLSSGIREHIR